MEIDKVKNQYERFPYPAFSWFSSVRPMEHARFEVGAKIIHGTAEHSDGKKIALLGCGTQEALAFGLSHKKSRITAVDISEKAIRIAKTRCRLRGLHSIAFVAQDLIAFSEGRQDFYDYVHCYGVIHHLRNPALGFSAIKQILKPEGFARIMVYSKAARGRITQLQKTLQLLKYSYHSKDFQKEVAAFVESLPWDNPLKITYEMHPEVRNKSGVVDAFLHSQESCFSLNELKKMLEDSQLFIHAWDFSKNVLELIKKAPGEAIEDKIEFLEATDQWPCAFTFWVSPISAFRSRINPI